MGRVWSLKEEPFKMKGVQSKDGEGEWASILNWFLTHKDIQPSSLSYSWFMVTWCGYNFHWEATCTSSTRTIIVLLIKFVYLWSDFPLLGIQNYNINVDLLTSFEYVEHLLFAQVIKTKLYRCCFLFWNWWYWYCSIQIQRY